MMSVRHYVPGFGVGAAFRCGRLPNQQFSKEEIPSLFVKEIGRITGISVAPEETRILWDDLVDEYDKKHGGLREFFLDGGKLGWVYAPRLHVPGQRWRIHLSQTSHEISAALQRIRRFECGYLIIEERLVRWGLVWHLGHRVQNFQAEYASRPAEWRRVLLVLDVHEDEILAMKEFISKMHLLNPVHDLIPIRVLEVLTVFRVLFRLSLQEFEMEYNASM
jgi:hypothetical protein